MLSMTSTLMLRKVISIWNHLEARCHGQWELRGEAGTAAIIAVVGFSLGRSFYCSASGASVAGLVPGVKQTPGSVSIV